MSREVKQIAAKLMTFDVAAVNSNPVVEEELLVEVVDFNGAGEIEIAFDDRNERCYLKMSLPDLISRVAEFGAPG